MNRLPALPRLLSDEFASIDGVVCEPFSPNMSDGYRLRLRNGRVLVVLPHSDCTGKFAIATRPAVADSLTIWPFSKPMVLPEVFDAIHELSKKPAANC